MKFFPITVHCHKLILLLITLAPGFLANKALAQDSARINGPHGFFDLNGYFDTRRSSDFTGNLLCKLTNRVTYFTFTNFYSGAETAEQSAYYSEHHLYRSISSRSAFDWSAQWMTMSGPANDAFRLGLRWRMANNRALETFCKKHNFIYTLAFHLCQFDADKQRSPFLSQLEHFYRKSWRNNRIYLSGFADMDLYYSNGVKWGVVTEHQLGVRITGGWYMAFEYRYNQYARKRNGVGLGLQYIIPY